MTDEIKVQSKNKKTKLIIAIVVVVIGVLTIVAIVLTSSNSAIAKQVKEQLSLGEKYLSELQYEQAIAAYELAIEIDPKCEDAYLALAEIYIEMVEFEKAEEILDKAVVSIGSETEGIKKLREELQKKQNMSDTSPTVTEVPTVDSGFVSWKDSGLEDHVMDWKDENLENAMRDITGIAEQDIMLSDVWELTELWLVYEDISDISALSELKNLTGLYLDDNNISDISALSGLTNLIDLSLDMNSISDIEPLSGLTNLEYLYLGGVRVNDISVLFGLKKLVALGLSNNCIGNIGEIIVWLEELDDLTYLSLSENNIDDISMLGNLKNLKSLGLYGNNISDISVLGKMSNLESLYLGNNNICDISILAELTNLTELYLSRNNISDISALCKLSKLEHLDLWNNEISDINVLSGLTNLTVLSLDDNSIRDINALAGLTNLTDLSLMGNDISDISVIFQLTKLRDLDLSYNEIRDISALSGLNDLKRLYISNNCIFDYSPITHVEYVSGIETYEHFNQEVAMDRVSVMAENLTVNQNDVTREVEITVSGITLQDSYVINKSTSTMNHTEYGWRIYLVSHNYRYSIGTESTFWTYNLGKESIRKLTDMEHRILHFDTHQVYEIGENGHVKMQYTPDSITWTFTMPQGYELDIEDVKRYEVEVIELDKETLQRVYIK